MNELDQTAKDILENGKEPFAVKRRHVPQRALRNTPSMNVEKIPLSGSESKRFELGELFRAAAGEGNLELVQSLLQKDPTLIYAADENYWQGLHEAIRGQRTRVVRYLVEHGADLNWKTASGGNALWVAKKTLPENHEIIRYLISQGAIEEI